MYVCMFQSTIVSIYGILLRVKSPQRACNLHRDTRETSGGGKGDGGDVNRKACAIAEVPAVVGLLGSLALKGVPSSCSNNRKGCGVSCLS